MLSALKAAIPTMSQRVSKPKSHVHNDSLGQRERWSNGPRNRTRSRVANLRLVRWSGWHRRRNRPDARL